MNTYKTDFALLERYNANDNEAHSQTYIDMLDEEIFTLLTENGC